MEIFLDTTNIKEIEVYAPTGIVGGVTTNPTLIAQQSDDRKDVIKRIAKIINGPVSVQVNASDFDGMIKEAKDLVQIAPNVIIKLPMSFDGMKACNALFILGIQTNITLCFSVVQAILAARAGATYVSCFVGRLDDIGQRGMDLIAQVKNAYNGYVDIESKILVASVRHIGHVIESMEIGADAITMSPKIFRQMFDHPMTTKGIEMFANDSKK